MSGSDNGGNGTWAKWVRTHGPWRVKGRHRLVADVFQIVGGERWALVLMWNLEGQPND